MLPGRTLALDLCCSRRARREAGWRQSPLPRPASIKRSPPRMLYGRSCKSPPACMKPRRAHRLRPDSHWVFAVGGRPHVAALTVGSDRDSPCCADVAQTDWSFTWG
jgi:hypothetical protein